MKSKILLTILVFIFTVSSQVIIEEDMSTDTINLFDASKSRSNIEDPSKSVALAMFGNVLLPGLGHKYIGKEKKAFAYFAIDAVAILGTIFSSQYSKKVYSNSRAFAFNYAGTRSTRDREDEYWKNIGEKIYKTVDDYNYVQVLERHPERKYLNDEDYWEWGSDDAQKKYREMREQASNLKVTSSFFLGAMLLNRAISMIDGRISAKRYNESVFSTMAFEATGSIQGDATGLALVKRF